eukprot:100753_1
MEPLHSFETKIKNIIANGCDLSTIASNQIKFFNELQDKLRLFTTTEINLETICTVQQYETYIDNIAQIVSSKENLNKEIPPPSLGIELFWRTHLLNPNQYYNDCMRKYGMIIPHHIITTSCNQYMLQIPHNIKSSQNKNFVRNFDLITAMKRQLKFAQKIYEINSKQPISSTQINIAIEKYYRFMYLLSHKSKPTSMISVPTTDIDLIWHSHQLIPQNYHTFSQQIANKCVINHNDTLSQDTLIVNSQKTKEFWNKIFVDKKHETFKYESDIFQIKFEETSVAETCVKYNCLLWIILWCLLICFLRLIEPNLNGLVEGFKINHYHWNITIRQNGTLHVQAFMQYQNHGNLKNFGTKSIAYSITKKNWDITNLKLLSFPNDTAKRNLYENRKYYMLTYYYNKQNKYKKTFDVRFEYELSTSYFCNPALFQDPGSWFSSFVTSRFVIPVPWMNKFKKPFLVNDVNIKIFYPKTMTIWINQYDWKGNYYTVDDSWKYLQIQRNSLMKLTKSNLKIYGSSKEIDKYFRKSCSVSRKMYSTNFRYATSIFNTVYACMFFGMLFVMFIFVLPAPDASSNNQTYSSNGSDSGRDCGADCGSDCGADCGGVDCGGCGG